MFSNRTDVNQIAFSDHLVTFEFEDFFILHLTRIFSDNFIIFWESLWIDQNRSVLPVSIGSVGAEIGWFRCMSENLIRTSKQTVGNQSERAPAQNPLKRVKQIYSDQFTKILKK